MLNIRIAFFTDTYLPQINGVTRTLKRIRSFLNDKKIDNIMLAPEDPEYISEEGLFTFKSFSFPFYPEMRISIPMDWQVDEIMASFRPDVIHLVTEYTLGLAGLKWAQRTKTPIVASYHTNIPDYLLYYNFPYLSETAWHYLKWFHNQCEMNFCPSNATYDTLKARGFKNLRIWGRGVDTDLFNPSKRDFKLRSRLCDDINGLLLFYAGRLAQEKDIDVLIKAALKIRRFYPEARLVLAGDGPMAKKLSNEAFEGMIFTGQLQQSELSVYYASSDIFVFASTSETYGNVVLEAMASGLPVIAPMCGGIKENLQPGINGLEFRSHDDQDMAKAIIKLIENAELRNKMGQKARQHAEGRTWNDAFAPLLQGYTDIASNNGDGSVDCEFINNQENYIKIKSQRPAVKSKRLRHSHAGKGKLKMRVLK